MSKSKKETLPKDKSADQGRYVRRDSESGKDLHGSKLGYGDKRSDRSGRLRDDPAPKERVIDISVDSRTRAAGTYNIDSLPLPSGQVSTEKGNAELWDLIVGQLRSLNETVLESRKVVADALSERPSHNG